MVEKGKSHFYQRDKTSISDSIAQKTELLQIIPFICL